VKSSPDLTRHSGETSNLHGNNKINPENKQWQTSGSTQAMAVSQHTSTASESPTTTTAQYANFMFNCSLLSTDRPPVLKSIPPPLFLQYHINTVRITSFLKTIFQQLQDELQKN
jgi:hypothetical protein